MIFYKTTSQGPASSDPLSTRTPVIGWDTSAAGASKRRTALKAIDRTSAPVTAEFSFANSKAGLLDAFTRLTA